MKESALERILATAMSAPGCAIYKLDAQSRRGAPDRVVVRHGVVTFVELKADDGVVSPIQHHEHERIRRAGGEVVVLRGAKAVRDFCDGL